MYAVVGCGDCRAVWVVEGRPETTGCPRCGKRHGYRKLKRFAETEAADEAREARAALLADREDYTEAFDDLDSFAGMDARAEESAIDDATYLEAAGLDAGAISEAGERAERGAGTSSSRKETVTGALAALDRPTEAEILEYAAERGVPAEYVERALARLVRRGEVSETSGRYRRL
jgi:predicted  nucleic acid-binding Zn-ribbon protein